MTLEGKSLHPFFSKSSKLPADATPDTIEKPADDPHHGPDDDTSPQSGQGPKKRARKGEGVKEKKTGSAGMKNQASLERFARPSKAQNLDDAAGNGASLAEPSLEEDPNRDRRKRQKTASPGPFDGASTPAQPVAAQLDWQQQLQAEVERSMPVDERVEDTVVRDVVMDRTLERQAQDRPEVTPPPITAPAADEAGMNIVSADPIVSGTKTVTPKKQIKVTKSGKLMSSPPKQAPEPSSSPRKRRGRKPTKPKLSPTVTVISYGSDAASRLAIGQKIDEILDRKKSSTGRPVKKALPKPAGPLKSTHPFFLGKPSEQKDTLPAIPASEQRPPTPRKSAVTPGKLRAETRRDRSPMAMPAFGMSTERSRAAKQSGLFEASWPTKETAHVRNLSHLDRSHSTNDQKVAVLALRPRKQKSAVTYFPRSEEVMTRLTEELSPDMHKTALPLKSEFEPPEDVRLPTRLLTTGIEIQRRVWDQVRTKSAKSDKSHHNLEGNHPAVTALYDDIERILTPFDEGRCESQAWAQKYSPKCAAHVLQTGQEAAVLKDWLQSLTVLAVGGALKSSTLIDMKKPPKKKRKKAVDDFIVSDDEVEDDEMVECSDSQNTASFHPKSFRRPRWTRNQNVILLSGPHGSGKSATVYAVAKELDFEVFEINPGMRRSGKDIQDKVGDMTANHLVNHKRSAVPAEEDPATTNNTDTERMDTALREDLSSGRQGTMTSFFQAKPTAKAKATTRVKMPELKKAATHTEQAVLPIVAAARKSQKQSLILFEEADILFEEDQQFWAQITKLALTSKRPIVITCNDERQIPSLDLPLAAMLRFHPPPVDLATDYLLVLAGREGHILDRQAVSDLYQSKTHDLRASITELNFWCQMSVGDRKGGLEWIYQRWPRGKDVDAHGRLLRVASEGTYEAGMGWLSHNMFETRKNCTLDKEEELSKEAWADWGINPMEWAAHGSNDAQTLVESSDASSRLKNLEQIDALADSLSAADVYCRVGLPTYEIYHHQPTDASLPSITDKARLGHTLAAPLLQVDHSSDFLNFDTCIFTQTHLLIQRAYPNLPHHTSLSDTSKPTTEFEYAKTLLELKDAQKSSINTTLTRPDFATALDILAAPPDSTPFQATSYSLTPSSFDRTFSIITLELAPYIRSIVAHEQVLEAQRLRISNLLSVGGTGKRPRTTRASRVALEGGVRETKRRDRWFDAELNFELVMGTAGGSGRAWGGGGSAKGDVLMQETAYNPFLNTFGTEG
ncbi:hypothetical protein N0V83_010627 [Neocucurbitaria cava]|uniref:AAA+ ATPase domain-containing protein n=1 Tax=Neocucurbitaria cava TaxID=798079 RepID=A0A9W9CGQ0_9PLEO|nr:hypothetical protein N0V83_010627 [Neocucurbitaria cava]